VSYLWGHMTSADEQRLVNLVDRFLSGADRSKALAAEIEGLLLEEFEDTELFEELIEPLSLYGSQEGPQYWTADELAELLRRTLRHLSTS